MLTQQNPRKLNPKQQRMEKDEESWEANKFILPYSQKAPHWDIKV